MNRRAGFGIGDVTAALRLPDGRRLFIMGDTLSRVSSTRSVLFSRDPHLAALGFIGVGLQPPTPELGLMMIEFLPHYEEAPWLIAAPVALLMLLVLGMMLLVSQGEPA